MWRGLRLLDRCRRDLSLRLVGRARATLVILRGRWIRKGDDQRLGAGLGRTRRRSRKVVRQRVGRKQEREEPSLPARRVVRRLEGLALLNAEDSAAERDRDVAVPACTQTGEERQPGERQAEPEGARECRRAGEPGGLDRREKPRSCRGKGELSPLDLHWCHRRGLPRCIGLSRLSGRPSTEGA